MPKSDDVDPYVELDWRADAFDMAYKTRERIRRPAKRKHP